MYLKFQVMSHVETMQNCNWKAKFWEIFFEVSCYILQQILLHMLFLFAAFVRYNISNQGRFYDMCN